MRFWILEFFELLSNTEVFTLFLNLQLGYSLFIFSNKNMSAFIDDLGQVILGINHHY